MPRDRDWYNNLVVEEAKLTEYLLSPTHLEGRYKHAFFVRLGFSEREPQRLADALIEHAQRAVEVATAGTPFGTKWALRGRLKAPDESEAVVQSIWLRATGASQVRLITAYPAKRG